MFFHVSSNQTEQQLQVLLLVLLSSHHFKYVLDPASMHLTHDMPLTKLYSSQDSTFFSLLLKEKRHHDISCIVSSLSVLFPKAKAGSISISLVVWWSVFAQYSV